MKRFGLCVFVAALLLSALFCRKMDSSITEKVDLDRGICVLLGDVDGAKALELARRTDLLIYSQLESDEEVEAVRRAADTEGVYGHRIWVEKGSFARIHLGDNLADRVIAVGKAAGKVSEEEALRVVCPLGRVLVGSRELVKSFPEGIDDWSHPYHGPDNNPQSQDQVARAPYLTQFLAEPYYAPLTQQAVASAGRVFKAFGNIAFHEREEALLNSLVAFNGYNGTMLWRRKLTPGVMIHRSTMVATPEVLYVGDDKSCKIIDTATGRLLDELTPPVKVAGGTFWKWMGLKDGVLYALIGEQEQKDPVTRQRRREHGWPWNPLTKGFNQLENPWGFGHNLLAIDVKSKKVLWSHHEEEAIDSRALAMKNGRIFIYRHGAFLTCLEADSGETLWNKSPIDSPELFEALGPYLGRQGASTNWRTTSFMKCSDKALYFAGPSVNKLLAVSAEDGSVLWEHPYDNFQLVLREEGLYGISNIRDRHKSYQFDPLSGEILAEFNSMRTNCTRPNGAVDSIFYRAVGGSVRLDTGSQTAQWISPMRAQCHDGVTIANGLLYWWPSTCDCHNTLYGFTCLGPAGNFDFGQQATEEERLEIGKGDITQVARLPESPADWPTFRANNLGTVTTQAVVSNDRNRLWWFTPNAAFTPTPPVSVGELVFFSGSDGIVRAVEAATGDLLWKAYTGGPVGYPPTVWNGRVLVGSGDGWVYAYEATTGRLLWRFNAAPVNRKIPVYGSLMSTWPVASGVLVEDGVAYCAAGILNYDGIHVYALDAVTGSIKWQNNTSGHLNPESRTGVSVQGHMLLQDGKLYLAGGTSMSPAVYDITNGECLNDPAPLKAARANSVRGRDLYRLGDKVVVSGKPLYADPDYPVYDGTGSDHILHTSADNQDIVWINQNRILSYPRIDKDLLHKIATGPRYSSMLRVQDNLLKLASLGKPSWELECEGSVALARSRNAILYSGTPTVGPPRLEGIDIKTGEKFWKQGLTLQSPPVAWGLAIDRRGRIMIALRDGQLMCFAPRSGI